jgi:alkyl sulfatase BDS1-like metallo-beta-lactamase superfamily hydrolase
MSANTKKPKVKKIEKDHITDAEIEAFNAAVRENYRLAIKEIRDENKNKAKRKTFKYDLGEDTDSDENENGLYGLRDINLDSSHASEKRYAQNEMYNFMVVGENKIVKSKNF